MKGLIQRYRKGIERQYNTYWTVSKYVGTAIETNRRLHRAADPKIGDDDARQDWSNTAVSRDALRLHIKGAGAGFSHKGRAYHRTLRTRWIGRGAGPDACRSTEQNLEAAGHRRRQTRCRYDDRRCLCGRFGA